MGNGKRREVARENICGGFPLRPALLAASCLFITHSHPPYFDNKKTECQNGHAVWPKSHG